MPPNMEKFYDPQFDLGDEEDKESFQIDPSFWRPLKTTLDQSEWIIFESFFSMTKRKK